MAMLRIVFGPDSIDEDHLKVQWSIPLDAGYSGAIIESDSVIVTETLNREYEVVLDRSIEPAVRNDGGSNGRDRCRYRSLLKPMAIGFERPCQQWRANLCRWHEGCLCSLSPGRWQRDLEA